MLVFFANFTFTCHHNFLSFSLQYLPSEKDGPNEERTEWLCHQNPVPHTGLARPQENRQTEQEGWCFLQIYSWRIIRVVTSGGWFVCWHQITWTMVWSSLLFHNYVSLVPWVMMIRIAHGRFFVDMNLSLISKCPHTQYSGILETYSTFYDSAGVLIFIKRPLWILNLVR